MAKRVKRSARREQALAELRRKQRQQRWQFAGIAVAVLALLAGLFWLVNRPKSVDADVPLGADRTAWGPVDAPVVIEEWSDFN